MMLLTLRESIRNRLPSSPLCTEFAPPVTSSLHRQVWGSMGLPQTDRRYCHTATSPAHNLTTFARQVAAAHHAIVCSRFVRNATTFSSNTCRLTSKPTSFCHRTCLQPSLSFLPLPPPPVATPNSPAARNFLTLPPSTPSTPLCFDGFEPAFDLIRKRLCVINSISPREPKHCAFRPPTNCSGHYTSGAATDNAHRAGA